MMSVSNFVRVCVVVLVSSSRLQYIFTARLANVFMGRRRFVGIDVTTLILTNGNYSITLYCPERSLQARPPFSLENLHLAPLLSATSVVRLVGQTFAASGDKKSDMPIKKLLRGSNPRSQDNNES